MLVDTSIFVPIFRDKSGERRERFRRFLRGRDYALSRYTQLELLQGCSSQHQWEVLHDFLEVQDYLEASPDVWSEAARIHFDLKRRGKMARSVIDCCIAQIAIEHRVPLVHNDNDFERIEEVRKLKLVRLDLQADR